LHGTAPDPLTLNLFAAIIIWQLRAIYRRRKARAAGTARARFSYMYGIKEKPAFVSFTDVTDDDEPRKTALLNSAPFDPFIRWKPQIQSVTLPSGVTVPPIAVTYPERSPKLQDEFSPAPKSGPSLSPLPSPPPAYRILGLHTIPLPSPPKESAPADIPPPTPMHRSPGRTVYAPVRESFDLPPTPGPSPSPRSASFQALSNTPPAPTPRASLASVTSLKPFPRLMIVTASFEPTRPDELRLRAGETLRLIREFDDEWCLVQHIGRLTERGVVPRFCLSERPRVVKNYVRLSNSIFNTVRRK